MANRNTTKASASVKTSGLSIAKAKLVFGFLEKVCDTTVALAKVNAQVIKTLPEDVLKAGAIIEEKVTDSILNSNSKFEDFAYNMLTSATAKECAARIAIAATDRMIRMMETAPLPHERNAREEEVEVTTQD